MLRTGLVASILLASAGAFADSTITLTASPQSATLPDGQSVPMWGYTCGDPTVVATAPVNATCTALNGSQQGSAWQPPLVTVPAGKLTINLVNALSFTAPDTSVNAVPTSIVIVGQLGGGLGNAPARIPSPLHAPQGTTWPGTLGGIDPATAAISVTLGGAGYVNPPAVTISGDGSGATAVATIANGVVTNVFVSSPGSGYTSATVTIDPPPCTINGTTCVGATATMNVATLQASTGDATFVPPPQADRVRSFGTEAAAGVSTATALTWNNLRPGTYLIESGTEPSIQGPMGLYGVLVVTEPDVAGVHVAYGTSFDSSVPLLLSEIDPAQNGAVDTAVRSIGFDEKLVWDAEPGRCGDPVIHNCYPPAVNYSPRYYLVNGASFDATAPAASGVAVPAAGTQQQVLLRLVNAGLHMHVPSVVGAPMTLVAEDGNKLPGAPRVQNEVFLAAGKAYDVTIRPTQTNAGTYDAATYAIYDRALGVSTNNQLDGGMQAYLLVNGGTPQASTTLSASDPTYYCVAGTTLAITDPSKGLLAGAVGANGVSAPTAYTGSLGASNLSVQGNGTFTYTQLATDTACGGTFTYNVNGSQPHTATITQCDATTNGGNGCTVAGAPTVQNVQFTSWIASRYASPPPGVLGGVVTNPGGLALSAVPAGPPVTGVTLNADGSFVATNASAAACPTTGLNPPAPAGASCVAFGFQAKNAQGTASTAATATVIFLPASNLQVAVKDAKNGGPITDYRWIIEEDRTFFVDPRCQVNSTDPSVRPSTCPPLPVESSAYNFHTSYMPVVAAGCQGAVSCESGQTLGGTPVVCDIGNGVCRTDGAQQEPVDPKDVHLDPTKRYYVSVLPGDGVNPTIGGAGGPTGTVPFDIATACGPYALDTSLTGTTPWAPGAPSAMCGHAMGGAQLAAGQTAVEIRLQETPLPTAKISVFVFQDDNPLNGENDAGGGVDVIAPNEAGLGGFEIKLFDQAGGLGDATGQITYDMFNQPVSNSLAGQKDPVTGFDACPITARGDGLIGMIPTCPRFESDGVTRSPLEGQAVIANLYPGLYEVQAYPAADRIGRGEEWLQTNTLDGGKPHEAFIKPNEPGYFQEFGPGGFHVAIGFANPTIINQRKVNYCATRACNSSLNVQVTNTHMSRTPDQRTYSSETYDHYSFTQCYVSIGPADAEDFAFQKCNPDGTANFTGMPTGVYKITVFDQWNDIILDGLVGTVTIDGDTTAKVFPVTQWRADLYTRTYIDANGNGIPDRDADGNDLEAGLALVNTNIHYRDGSIGFFNNTDLNGYAGFNEIFPLMNWLVVETTSTRFKPTGVHTVYDAGGPVDCSDQATALGLPCTSVAAHLASTAVRTKLPDDLRLPGAKYCDSADCPGGTASTSTDAGGGASTGTIFPAMPWGTTQGWQGLLGQDNFIEFGVKPFKPAGATTPAENGGISGMVIYASTRPFDDPALSLQLQWEPGVPHVQVNLYKKDVDGSGNEKLTLVDQTTSASWDDWAQGFRTGADGTTLLNAGSGATAGFVPNMNCPGQDATSPFFQTLNGSKQWLDAPDSTGNKKALAYNSQFKCYDGWSQLNQIQPAPYDGLYKFPSVLAVDSSGKPSKTNCKSCVTNPDDGTPMLPSGTYVVEVVLPPGYELVKEEDKNILLGDVYIAPISQQFAGFGNIFIMPDQAAVNAFYNPNSPGGLNKTTDLGAAPRHEGDTGSVETFWPCVGDERIVPDLNSLYPGAGQAAPFAGAKRRLCDRKEVALQDEHSVLAKFFVFSSTHVAGHFTGLITNDFAAEFDPFSPQFGEKFGPPNLPVAMRDFSGNEVARVYGDQWGVYNGLYFSSYSVNPPNPTGYVPQMSIACMNDPGPIVDTRPACTAPNTPVGCSTTAGQLITDPSYNPGYSDFCYEWPFMPGQTAYMDTPVLPTQSFADGYNLPDSEYPNLTPAVKSVVSSAAQGPWVPSSGVVSSVTPGSNRGSFTAVPAVGFTGGGGGGAAATAVLGVNAVSVNTSNRYATGTPTVTFHPTACPAGVPCVDAVGTVNMTGTGTSRTVGSITVSQANMGRGFTTPAAVQVIVACTGTCSQQVAVAPTVTSLRVGEFVVTNGGSGYTSAPTVSLSPTGGASTPTATLSLVPGGTLTIAALGDKQVQNPMFSGPNATAAPFNQKTITRHYGFGTTPGTVALVGSDGVARPFTGVTWSDTTITGTPPSGLPACAVQQPNQPAAQCGELVITRGDNGKQSIDAITVTYGGSAPWIVTESAVTAPAGKSVKDYTANFGRMGFSPIQTAIDSAAPGDLILVQPGTYRENLLMWKPVRLQGVGAGAVVINADAHPAGKMDQWRRQVDCVFGLTVDGAPNLNNPPGAFAGVDPLNAGYSCPTEMHQRVDRIPWEGVVGWDTASNGNLAQVLQEPTLMGSYEGAGITVLGRGIRMALNSNDFWGQGAPEAAFPNGSSWLTGIASDCISDPTETDGRDYGTSNYYCNPSRIDGLSIVNSSQGGGGLFIHGWAHNLEVGNTRISGNHGTLAGAINLGNGEIPDAYINDGIACGVTPAVSPCPPLTWHGYRPVTNGALAFQFNTNVRIHHNMLYNNASIGDALFSGTPAGAGGITVSAGADGYRIDHNWIAGNLSTGDGGGVQHIGLSFQGTIQNNYVLFNQSTNPTLPTSGGGIVVEAANLDRVLNGTECGSLNDQDCPPGLGEGTGFGLAIDGNLILGNSAESGTGGGLRIQQVNGTEFATFQGDPSQWYDVDVTNNVIANNVAGWDGGGVSLQDALRVTFVNNTVVSNDTTATAGSLFKTLGAINANTPPPGCTPTTDPTQPQNPNCLGADAPHSPQPAGLVVQAHTPNLIAALGANTVCPRTAATGGVYPYSAALNGDCRQLSKPAMVNDLFFQNRAFSVDVVGPEPSTSLQSQQNIVALTPALNQTATGQCPSGASYWDIGLRTDDLTAGTIPLGTTLTLSNSIYTGDPQGVIVPDGSNFVNVSSPVISQFCNGARTAPESCTQLAGGLGQSCNGYNAPPGASETTGLSSVFVLNGIKPTATVDEGHNWLNLSFGPLTLNRSAVQPGNPNAPELMVASAATGSNGGAYSVPGTSPAVNQGNNNGINGVAPKTDFFGNTRPGNPANPVDIGAVEFQAAAATTLVVANPAPMVFNAVVGTTTTQDLTVSNNGTTSFVFALNTGIVTGTGLTRVTGFTGDCPTAGATAGARNLQPGRSCDIRVRFAAPSSPTTVTGSVAITGSATVANAPVTINATAVAATYRATVGPNPLAFGNWAIGTTSAPLFVTITNTGNSALTSLSIGGIVSPFGRVTTGSFPVNAPNCGATLNAGSSCAVKLRFSPTAVQSYTGSMTIGAANGATITTSPVALTGTGVAARSGVSITPSPLAITLDSAANPLNLNAYTDTGLVTLTNACTAATCSSVSVTAVTVTTTTGPGTFSNGPLAGPDTCTGAALAPGASCSVSVRYSVSATDTRGTTATGTITLTDSGTGSPQSGVLNGFATP